MTLDDLRTALKDAPGHDWLDEAEATVRTDPARASRLFAQADRRMGRTPLAGDWTAGQAARGVLLAALGDAGQIALLYRHGDAAERLAVLRALPLLAIGDAAVPLLHDALRTNDTRLVGAALGPYARHLDAATWRQGVIKCVFMGVPLAVVADLDRRADAELTAMLAALAEERAAAGRDLPADAAKLLERTKELH
jgi:nucleotide-binding universal stress UspA family protein